MAIIQWLITDFVKRMPPFLMDWRALKWNKNRFTPRSIAPQYPDTPSNVFMLFEIFDNSSLLKLPVGSFTKKGIVFFSSDNFVKFVM
jgi:hypothetical protein